MAAAHQGLRLGGGRGGEWRAVLASMVALMVVAGCSSPQPSTSGGSAPAVREIGATKVPYKIGKPYAIDGVWYHPRVDEDYDEVGIASWYGPGFHGKLTANGETYDMNDLTAAHTTLPLPSVVQVTNLDNGRAMKLRVNDRGPFVDDRIIDVSRRAAQLLGFIEAGTARVRVTYLADDSAAVLAGQPWPPGEFDVASSAQPEMTSQTSQMTRERTPDVLPDDVRLVVAAAPAPAPALGAPPPVRAAAPSAAPAPVPAPQRVTFATPPAAPVPPLDVGDGGTFVQAGAFADAGNATRARQRLARVGAVRIENLRRDGRELYRVRLGPYDSGEAALVALAAAVREGYPGSLLVFE